MAAPAPRLILASASPRRLDLLRQIGLEPDAVDPAQIDESPKKDEDPVHYARRIAREKALAVQPRHPGAFVLAADTVVALGRRILPKAEDEATAKSCLELLSGRAHRVIGAIALATPEGKVGWRVVTTRVHVKRLEKSEIDAYLASGEWQGKAGGYAIQGRASAFIPMIVGSYPNVVGLPLNETLALMQGLGFRR